MKIAGWGWVVLLMGAGLGLWLLLGSGRVFGHDIGGLGMTLLIGVTWLALHGVSALPRGEAEAAVAPGEWKAWIGLGFMAVATVYLLVNLPAFTGESIGHAPLSSGVVRNLVLLLVAWVVLSQLVAARWKGRVQADERDREIERAASEWGRGALIFLVVAYAVTFGFSPADRLQWATHFMIANLMLFALMWGWLAEYAATAAMYVRDRRA